MITQSTQSPKSTPGFLVPQLPTVCDHTVLILSSTGISLGSRLVKAPAVIVRMNILSLAHSVSVFLTV